MVDRLSTSKPRTTAVGPSRFDLQRDEEPERSSASPSPSTAAEPIEARRQLGSARGDDARGSVLAREAQIRTLMLGREALADSRQSNLAGNEVERRSYRARSGDLVQMMVERSPGGDLVRAEVSATRREDRASEPSPVGNEPPPRSRSPSEAEQRLFDLRAGLSEQSDRLAQTILEHLPAVVSEEVLDFPEGLVEETLRDAGFDEAVMQLDEVGGRTLILSGPERYRSVPLPIDADDLSFEYKGGDRVDLEFTRADGTPGAVELD